jgi:hypothetical protein
VTHGGSVQLRRGFLMRRRATSFSESRPGFVSVFDGGGDRGRTKAMTAVPKVKLGFMF